MATLAGINSSLDEFQKSDKELRERLFVVQVAKKYDWDAANKMARCKAGEYDDPELTKVLEERERKEEKAKRSREKERARSLTPSTSKEVAFLIAAKHTLEEGTREAIPVHLLLPTPNKNDHVADMGTVQAPGTRLERKKPAASATKRDISGETVQQIKSNILN
jgi:hypothetical protein